MSEPTTRRSVPVRTPFGSLQMGRTVVHHARDIDGDDQLLDHSDRLARHLPRDQAEPSRPWEHELSAVDADGLHGLHRGAACQLRAHRRHVRTREDVHVRLRGLLGLLDPVLGHVARRHLGGALADLDASRSRNRWSVSRRQLGADPDRRFPAGPAGLGARNQQRRGDLWRVHRPGARRAARTGRMASRVPRLGAIRRLRNVSGLA